ncbi:Mu transposase C-terminal domain-containing protein [Thiothrix nivea]|uniref:Integrase catalytic region n=1 Tax=Thiothrix nivea (strain ATCC 35100 / DSM 5205 / JP2) TaxID=870187 RepID=A0A656HAL7_THINJ|nr:Mu transposase C-terminal domain-containing protein [Thiothrix nivea]EIJ33337.1 Integrase catalytic region [Thiothrix nivea DSM 5205]
MPAPISNLITLPQSRLMQTASQPASAANSRKQAVADRRLAFVRMAIDQMETLGWSRNRAAEHVYNLVSSPRHDMHSTAVELGKSGNPVSKAQIYRWLTDYQQHGMEALIDNRSGRAHQEEGWELRAMRLYARPQKPSITWVVDQLNKEGFEAKYNRVHRYLMALPTDLTTHSAGRLGAKEVKLNHRSYRLRTTENLPVGHCYQLDGHTVDVYIAHPQTGGRWRPELTAVMDVASRYIPSWWIGEAENAQNTLFALADAFTQHDHVPACLHLDNGSGFKGKLMNDPSTGYYRRFGLDVIFAIPGNAKAKGQIERWFGTMERGFNKGWDTYCGTDMSKSVLRDIVRPGKKNTTSLPSLSQWIDAFRGWLDDYHNRPHRGLDGRTPAQMWAQLQRVPLEYRPAAIVLPRKQRKVARGQITLDGRIYRAPDLLHFEGADMVCEYSVHNDQYIRVLTANEQWVCDAKLAEKAGYLPDSRIEQQTQERLRQQIKRNELHIEEDKRRAGMTLGHEAATQGILELETQKESGTNAPLPHHLDQPDPEIVIDLTKWTPGPTDKETTDLNITGFNPPLAE